MGEKIFNILKDGAWHNLNNLAEETGAPIDKLIEYAHLLSDQGIITYEEDTQRIRIKTEWKKLLPDETVIGTAQPGNRH